MKILRSYPQPDSPREDLGPRERAMAVYKYLLGLEPEAAAKHPLFDCIVRAFENAAAVAVRRFDDDYESTRTLPDVLPSLVEEIRNTTFGPENQS